MTVLTREQFAEHWDTVKSGLGSPESNLWAYERENGPECVWFVCVKPFQVPTNTKQQFWAWCKEYCSRGMCCYSASDTEEWWGFVNKQEMTLWLLRWA